MRPRNPNYGHGHVYKRPDGYLARCGGPAICPECSRDKAEQIRDAALAPNPLAALDAKLPVTKSTPVVFPGGEVVPGLTVEGVEEARRLLDANEIPPFHEEDDVPEETHKPLPVAGYKEQTIDDIRLANELKFAEERYLRILDRLLQDTKHDARFLALARTHMQTANMFAVRAIFQPQRVKLPEDGDGR